MSKDIIRYLEIDYGWMLTIFFISLVLSGTSFMQANYVYFISGSGIILLLSFVIFAITRK